MAHEEEEPTIMQKAYADAVELISENPQKAMTVFEDIVLEADPEGLEMKTKENAIYKLGNIYVQLGEVKKLEQLLTNVRPFLTTIPKAKTAKIVRTLINLVGEVSRSDEQLVKLCLQSIEWCKQEKRTFLRQRIESRLASLYLNLGKFNEALALLKDLTREVKKLDDKLLLVEICLTESRIQMRLKNTPVAKAALTAGRAASNSIYCPPELQAQIDLQSGIISAAEKDFKTSFSYFYESFEGFQTANDPKTGLIALKYMLLSKILMNEPEEVRAIVSGKAGLKYAGKDVEALQAVANSQKARSLHQFQQNLGDYKVELTDDPIIHSHLQRVYDNLFEQNLLRLVEPFSCVQIGHIADLIGMDTRVIESKFSEMILDKKLRGILDQGKGNLVLFEDVPENKTYEAAIGTITEMNTVVDLLVKKAQKLHAYA